MGQELEYVRHRLVESGIDAAETSVSEITIRAVHKEVGDLVVRSENGELIVRIGDHFHSHFAADDDSPGDADRLVAFVTDFVNDRAVLTVQYLGRRPVTARVGKSIIAFAAEKPNFLSRILGPFRGRQKTSHSYKWSGPLSDSDSPEPEEDDEMSALAARIPELNPDQMKLLEEYLKEVAEYSKAKEQKSGDKPG